MLSMVVAEDNDHLRKHLVKKLSSIDDIEVVYSTGNGKDFLKALEKLKPDIAVTDIDMPGMSGIEATRAIREILPDIEVIFITFYGELIGEAVELYAADFLEKPIDEDRLKQTLERIKNRLAAGDRALQLKSGERVEVVRQNDLYFVEAFKKKSRVYLASGEFVCDLSLKEMEEMLDKDTFFRTGRSYLVHIGKVLSIKPVSRALFEIMFKDIDSRAYLSRKFYEDFRARLKEPFN